VNPLDDATFLLRTGQISAALALLEACLGDVDAGEPTHLRALLLTSTAHEQEGRLEAAIEAANRATVLACRLGDAAGEAEALCLRAGACHKLGLFRDAFEGAAAGLAQARTLGHARIEAIALRHMSNQVLRNGDELEARGLLEQSLALARRAADDESEFWALNNLSNVLGIWAARCASEGDHDGSHRLVTELVSVVEQALQVARRTGHWLQLAYAVSNMADAHIVEGNHARARELVAEYAGIAQVRGNDRLLAYANLDEVRMLRAEGRADEAVAVIDSEAHRRLLAGNDDIALATEISLYEIHKDAGRFEAALRHHENVARIDVERLTRRAEQQLSVVMARIEVEQLHRAVHEDALTGTGNRRAADAALERAGNEPMNVALVDIDHFKSINDTHGHATGDAVLAALGRLMRQSLRSRDQVFRYGGEEFLLIIAGATAEAAREVCERQRLAIAQHDWSAIAPCLAVTASFGLARQAEGEATGLLVSRADTALYAAKRGGRNRIAVA
jgi:diguanylate cyclase (GGDEF)-like protein